MKKLPFELCPTCMDAGKEHYVSIVSEEGTPCYWCKQKVFHPDHPPKKKKRKKRSKKS